MVRDRRRHAGKKEVQGALPVPVSAGHDGIDQQREQFLVFIRVLAREAARIDHETDLAKMPEPRQSFE